VRKLVVVSGTFRGDGKYPEVRGFTAAFAPVRAPPPKAIAWRWAAGLARAHPRLDSATVAADAILGRRLAPNRERPVASPAEATARERSDGVGPALTPAPNPPGRRRRGVS
jgi:hypothetical protein